MGESMMMAVLMVKIYLMIEKTARDRAYDGISKAKRVRDVAL
jgi:hypothetical protein